MTPILVRLDPLRAPSALRPALLAWYDTHARALPWRIGPADRARGVAPIPYLVWLSEVMLQQTTTAHATPYFLEFVRRWPTIGALAAEADEAVMSAWAGLGYYARARNLLACARAVATLHGGRFPGTEPELRTLPGLGPYTAAAVAAIAFDQPANVVDGNVERVMARLFAVEAPLPDAKAQLSALASTLVEAHRPGDWAQALMDLGATICRPKAPDCDQCPLNEVCLARATGAPQDYPRRRAREERPRRHGVAYLLTRGDEILQVRRAPSGLLGGMLALPTSEWRSRAFSPIDAVAAAPMTADWEAAGEIQHVFTHFALTLSLLRAEARDGGPEPQSAIWTPIGRAADGLPSVFAKALRAGLERLI